MISKELHIYAGAINSMSSVIVNQIMLINCLLQFQETYFYLSMGLMGAMWKALMSVLFVETSMKGQHFKVL